MKGRLLASTTAKCVHPGVSEGKTQTELLIVHVATLSRGHLPFGGGRHRLLGPATVEHDFRDLAQSGRIDQKVVRMKNGGFSMQEQRGLDGERKEARTGEGRENRRPVYKIAWAAYGWTVRFWDAVRLEGRRQPGSSSFCWGGRQEEWVSSVPKVKA